jgi:hypothetical protein
MQWWDYYQYSIVQALLLVLNLTSTFRQRQELRSRILFLIRLDNRLPKPHSRGRVDSAGYWKFTESLHDSDPKSVFRRTFSRKLERLLTLILNPEPHGKYPSCYRPQLKICVWYYTSEQYRSTKSLLTNNAELSTNAATGSAAASKYEPDHKP